MFRILSGFPDDVLAVSATGKVSAADYEQTLVPAAEGRMRHHKPLKLFFHLDQDFSGMEMGALKDDAKLGMAHWRDWSAVAIVTDAGGWRDVVGFFRLIFHHPVRLFFEADYDKAKAWIAQDEPAQTD